MNVGKDITKFTDETKSLKPNDFTQLLSEEKVRSFHCWIFHFLPQFRVSFRSGSFKQNTGNFYYFVLGPHPVVLLVLHLGMTPGRFQKANMAWKLNLENKCPIHSMISPGSTCKTL